MMSEPTLWFDWIRVAAFIIGLSVGSLAVFSPSWVWLRVQKLSASAVTLAAFGFALVSMSIWKSVEIEGAGIKVFIGELRQTTSKINNISEDIDLLKRNISETNATVTDKLDSIFLQNAANIREISGKYEALLDAQNGLLVAGIDGSPRSRTLRQWLGGAELSDAERTRRKKIVTDAFNKRNVPLTDNDPIVTILTPNEAQSRVIEEILAEQNLDSR